MKSERTLTGTGVSKLSGIVTKVNRRKTMRQALIAEYGLEVVEFLGQLGNGDEDAARCVEEVIHDRLG